MMLDRNLARVTLVFLLLPSSGRAQCFEAVNSFCSEIQRLESSTSFSQVARLANQTLDVLRKHLQQTTGSAHRPELRQFYAAVADAVARETLDFTDRALRQGELPRFTRESYETLGVWQVAREEWRLDADQVRELQDLFEAAHLATGVQSCLESLGSRKFKGGCEVGRNRTDVGNPDSPSYQATQEARISPDTDSVEKKVIKALQFLTGTGSLHSNEPGGLLARPPEALDSAALGAHFESLASRARYGRSYQLDGLRGAEDILRERIGGGCGSYAKAFAAILLQSGVPQEDIRIVTAGTNDEYRRLCRSKGARLDETARAYGSGHVFVMVRINGQWKIVNTTHSPVMHPPAGARHRQELLELRQRIARVEALRTELRERSRRGASREELQPRIDELRRESATLKSRMDEVLLQLDLSDLEAVDFASPESLTAEVAQRPVSIPSFESLPERVPDGPGGGTIGFRNMTVIDVQAPDSLCAETLQDRLNRVVSGSRDSPICRYDPADLAQVGVSSKNFSVAFRRRTP